MANHTWSILPKEALHVSTSHELQQNEARQRLQAHTNAPHYVLVIELTANKQQRKEKTILEMT